MTAKEETEKAIFILEENMSINTQEILDEHPYFKDFILDSMQEYADSQNHLQQIKEKHKDVIGKINLPVEYNSDGQMIESDFHVATIRGYSHLFEKYEKPEIMQDNIGKLIKDLLNLMK